MKKGTNELQKGIALAVMRLQPLHNGHKILIETALRECETLLLAIGSADKIDARNPFDYDTRRVMVGAVFAHILALNPPRLIVFGMRDIGAKTKREWADFVIKEIARNSLPKPDSYYAGSAEDASWFHGVLALKIVDRTTIGEKINATKIREAISRGEDIYKLPLPYETIEIIRSKYGF